MCISRELDFMLLDESMHFTMTSILMPYHMYQYDIDSIFVVYKKKFFEFMMTYAHEHNTLRSPYRCIIDGKYLDSIGIYLEYPLGFLIIGLLWLQCMKVG